MAAHSSTTRNRAHSTQSRHKAAVAELAATATSNATAIRVMSKVLRDIMEEIHGRPYRVDVSHDPSAPLILIRPNG
jgi:hypothetical protein